MPLPRPHLPEPALLVSGTLRRALAAAASVAARAAPWGIRVRDGVTSAPAPPLHSIPRYVDAPMDSSDGYSGSIGGGAPLATTTVDGRGGDSQPPSLAQLPATLAAPPSAFPPLVALVVGSGDGSRVRQSAADRMRAVRERVLGRAAGVAAQELVGGCVTVGAVNAVLSSRSADDITRDAISSARNISCSTALTDSINASAMDEQSPSLSHASLQATKRRRLRTKTTPPLNEGRADVSDVAFCGESACGVYSNVACVSNVAPAMRPRENADESVLNGRATRLKRCRHSVVA